MRIKNRLAESLVLPLVLAALSGIGFAFYRFGLHVLDPSNIGWLRGDSTWHFLVWHVFRREPLGFPPGEVSNYLAPLGTSLGSADALPLLAFFLKPFSPLLGTNFQYLGPWLFLSYTLQGVFGYLLAQVFCKNRWLALLFGLFFLPSPIMIFRAGHVALGSHWLILFALWHYFATARRADFYRRSYAVLWLVVVVLGGLIHPYLAAMVYPLAFVSLWREWRFGRLTLPYALGLLAGMTGVLVLVWWLEGLLSGGQELAAWGFDYFFMNLNAPLNPLGRSNFLPTLPLSGGQYEGFAYFGLGMLVLGVAALLLLVRSFGVRAFPRVLRRFYRAGHLPLLILAFGFFLFSLGKTVTLGDHALFDFGLFANFKTLVSSFRAPGRFFWPVYYLIFTAVLAYLVRKLPSRGAALVLGAALTLQVIDLKINMPFREDTRTFSEHLTDSRWQKLASQFETLAVIPAFERTTAHRGDYAEFVYLAAGANTKVTTGAVARDPLGLDGAKQRLRVEALQGPRNKGRVYIFSAVAFAERYASQLSPGLHCHELNAYVACYSNKVEAISGMGPEIDVSSYVPPGYKRVKLADYLETYRNQTVVVVAKKGVGDLPSSVSRVLFRGASTPPLPRDGSYAAVIRQGYVSFDASSPDKAVEEMWQAGDVLGTGTEALEVPEDLKVFSVGIPSAKAANVTLAGRKLLESKRGLNIVVLDDKFKVISQAVFDTFITNEAVVKK